MPRAQRVKPQVEKRLSDQIAWGVSTRAFPAEVVDEVVMGLAGLSSGVGCCRPGWWVYFVLAIRLFSGRPHRAQPEASNLHH